MGCIVNGPGEAKHVDIGVTGGGKNNHQIYLNGKKVLLVKIKILTKVISELIEENLKMKNKNISTVRGMHDIYGTSFYKTKKYHR